MSGNNNGNNGPVPGFPEEIEITDLEFLLGVSGMIAAKHRFEGEPDTLTVSRKKLFGGDQEAWKLFVTLFFPEKVEQRNYANSIFTHYFPASGKAQRKLRFNKKEEFEAFKEEVETLFDYLIIKKEDYPAVLEHLRIHSLNAPPETVAPTRVRPSAPYVRQYSNNLGNLNNQPNENNFNNNENNYPEMGYANSNEENLYGKLSSKNFKKYGKGGAKRRGRTRKIKKSKKTKKGKSRRAH